jgi:hypothetical protein
MRPLLNQFDAIMYEGSKEVLTFALRLRRGAVENENPFAIIGLEGETFAHYIRDVQSLNETNKRTSRTCRASFLK